MKIFLKPEPILVHVFPNLRHHAAAIYFFHTKNFFANFLMVVAIEIGVNFNCQGIVMVMGGCGVLVIEENNSVYDIMC